MHLAGDVGDALLLRRVARIAEVPDAATIADDVTVLCSDGHRPVLAGRSCFVRERRLAQLTKPNCPRRISF